MQVSERKRRGNPALQAMAAKPPDISEYLRSQGFGPRELATLEVADRAAIAGQLAFELNIPHSEELAKVVESLVAAALKEDGMLQRTGGVLASDLAWTLLAGSASAPARPWLVSQPALSQEEDTAGAKSRGGLGLLLERRSRSSSPMARKGPLESFVFKSSGHASWEKSWRLWGRRWSRR